MRKFQLLLISILFLLPYSVHAAVVTINSNITSNTTWNAGDTYHVTSSITLYSGVTFTIPAGTVVKMNPGIYITIYGNLQAGNVSGTGVVFTSRDDNTVGEDVPLSDGTPTKGDWNQINLNGAGSNASVLENVIIKYPQYGIYFYNSNGKIKNSNISNTSSYGVYTYVVNTTASVTIEGNTISNGNSYGIYVDAHSSASTSPVVINNTVTNNSGKGLDCRVASVTFTGNSFSGNGSPSRFCTIDALLSGNPSNTTYSDIGDYVEVNSFNISSTIGTLPNVEKPIVVYGGTLTSGKTLTISPGNIFRLGAGAYINIYGNLQAIGTVAEPIVFTSKDDNSYGGNIVGISDGTPTKGDWVGITLYGSSSSASVFDNIVSKYAGTPIYFYSGSQGKVKNSYITQCSGHGIRAYQSSTNPTIEGNTISECNSDGININGGSSATIRNNTIVKNNGVGIYNQSSSAILKNNISYGNQYGIQCTSAMGTNIKYNLINGNTTGRQNGTNCTLDTTNLDQDPLFTNYVEGDYSLQAGSPAIDAGDPTMGNHPLSNNTYDIGAIEFINGIVKVSSATIYNPEGKILTYTWEFISDPSNGVDEPVFSGPSSGTTSSVNANVSVAFVLKYLGNYTLKLTITEGGNPVTTNSYNFTVQ